MIIFQVASSVRPDTNISAATIAREDIADPADEAVDESEGEEPMDDAAESTAERTVAESIAESTVPIKVEPVSAEDNTTNEADADASIPPSEKALSAAGVKSAQSLPGTPKPISIESGKWFYSVFPH